MKRLSTPIFAILILLSGCTDVARQVGSQNGAPVYEVFGKSRLASGLAVEERRDSASLRSARREEMRNMAMATCPNGYRPVGSSQMGTSAWHRGEDGSPFNIVLRETQNTVCTN
ncbi:hypothetical protein SAMN06273572_104235 [Monaibacterium marinum]|uniref:Lipoprotein n=1 Tax=Pontivivens marinum TaxID=1690039 RepID=A0A2C9CT45_9RHOB|nr:hypothetical protein SAMN06273572_104235 [Monaibacterium marinum]